MNDSIIQFFLLVCQKLEELQLPYMLTGSAAMNYYSVIRTTQDLDIVLELQESEVGVFLQAFPNHYYHEPSIISEIKRKGMFNLIDLYKFENQILIKPKCAGLKIQRGVRGLCVGKHWIFLTFLVLFVSRQKVQSISVVKKYHKVLIFNTVKV